MNNINSLWFRTITIVSAILPLISALIIPRFVQSIPYEHTKLIYEEYNLQFQFFVLFNFALGILSSIGLLMYWNWARIMSLVGIVFSFILYAASAYFVDSGLKVAVDYVATSLGGAVITLAYFSPIAKRFR